MTKTVRIRADQGAWLDENSVNFSDLVRRLLDEEIARRGAPARPKGARAST